MSSRSSLISSSGSSEDTLVPHNPFRQALIGGTKSNTYAQRKESAKSSRMGIIPIDSTTFISVSVLFSLIFIFTVSCAFMGADTDEPYLRKMLNGVAESDPGIVLFGESVDVDVDEPSITIRWSILACGKEYVLPGSTGAHGSDLCGLPSSPLRIFVDSDNSPTAVYDPSQIPFNRNTGERRSIQNLVQFDSNHVLDVHEARLYPFDTYVLTSTLRATTSNHEHVPIRMLATIYETSSFDVATSDVDSYVALKHGKHVPSRDIDMRVRRPASARAFALVLFALGWMLTHVAIGNLFVARWSEDVRTVRKHVISAFAILVTLPQLRNSMPDAPDLDGVLIDCIGFFAQMIVAGLAAIALLLLLVTREFDLKDATSETPSLLESGLFRFPPNTKSVASRALSRISESISHLTRPRAPRVSREAQLKPLLLSKARTMSPDRSPRDFVTFIRDLNDEYVFPPRIPVLHRARPSEDVD